MCIGGWNPNEAGSPIFKYRTGLPAASTACASATILRMAYEKRLTRDAMGIDRAVRESGIVPILRSNLRRPACKCKIYTHYVVLQHRSFQIPNYCSHF